ncbi:hypothetical protein BS639_23455 [Rouxiella silvae]|uniref:HTH merR-type domain-containing protein n=1 Tax=Rouxiella silvae TaxID=1646373 RepID=A0ABX3TU88_9GAMM|nr:MerR family transcriptional regulator [Rouxiella silvae]ORJ18786.1 hypothetical protein BS639_23455 [Rouxiella silvae]
MDIHSCLKDRSPPLPCHYSIETAAQYCGVLPATLRVWQRYGLINPERDEKGSCWYSESDLTRLHAILKKVTAGVPIALIPPYLNEPDVRPDIEGKIQRRNSSWRGLQAAILECLGEGKLPKLRRILWRFGREYPLHCLVNKVLRPIREFLATSNQGLLGQQKGLLDSIIIEYATYVMRTSRSHPETQVLLLPMQIDDPLELWLEALKLAGEGLNVELISLEVNDPDLSAFKVEHYMIWSDSTLDSRQQAKFDRWLNQGLPVMLVGKAANLKVAYKYQNGDF